MKSAPEMDDIFGKGSGSKSKLPPPSEDDDDMDADEDTDEPGDEELPPEFESAYDEYSENPSAQTAYRMIEACKGGGGGSGLALLLGPKGKK